MQPAVLQVLEFSRIVEAVSGFAATPLGSLRLDALRPSSDPRRVAQWQAATTETTRFIELHGVFPLTATPDLPSILGNLAIEGRPLEPLRLLALADYLESVDATRAAIRRADSGFVILRSIAETVASFKGEAAEVRHKIDPSGEVLDDASPELRSVRDRLRRQRTRLRGTMESFLRNKDTSRYLQDQIVTDRNGRLVLVVRAEHRASIPGILHGSSASGASLYLEPLSTVEINNDIVALEQQETEEVRRILVHLTDLFRRRALDLQRTIESATDLDVIQAKARFSALIGGVEPSLASDGAFDLRAARHPLLMSEVTSRLKVSAGSERDATPRADADEAPGAGARSRQASPAEPVPVDIRLTPPASVLVITGPNTGGKTVALKTAGLLVLMAQAGLHIPAAGGSRLPVFRSVFADIGDEQSIAANLSTFSWHVSNLVQVERALALPALVLLDEPGNGTDPIEGGALGMAVVEHLRTRGAHVVATTHYEALKSYASTNDAVACAAFGFDAESFAPTYRLVYGSPGRSLALEIAGRLGLNPAILEQARSNVSAREAQLAEHMARIDEELHGLEHERRLVLRERESIEDGAIRLRAREQALKEKEERLKHRLDEELETRLRSARQQIDKVVDDLRRQVEQLGAEAQRRALHGKTLSTGEPGAVRSEARAALDQVAERLQEHAEPPVEAHRPEGPPARVGDRVAVRGLGLEGRVLAVLDGEAEVDVRGKRLRAKLTELNVVGGAEPAAASRVSVKFQVQSRDDVPTDLNVIGCTVDEALTRAEKFLDEMLLADQRVVRIIHGHGTGQLRRAFGEFLQRHPFVASHQAAPLEQGGSGVTVVELKE
jgi:DNA mismatch repair protein MutS2